MDKLKKYESDRKCINHIVIYDDYEHTSIPKLFEVYGISKSDARVFFNNKGPYSFTRNKVVIFEYDNGDFQVCHFIRRYGISKTCKMWNREKKVRFLSYVGGKFWSICGKSVKQMIYNDLININNFGGLFTKGNKLFDYFMNRFNWFEVISKSTICHTTSFNKIVQNKLFGERKLNVYFYGVPYNVCREIFKIKKYNEISGGNPYFLSQWKLALDVMDNIGSFRAEMYDSDYFADMVSMANKLGRRINCKWGLKRLKEEHDKWSIDLINIMVKYEDCRDLRINKIYKEFESFSGYRLLKTNMDVVAEGMLRKHCVGTYIDKIEKGICGIYSIGGYTLELRYVNNRENENLDEIMSNISSVIKFDYSLVGGLKRDILYIRQFRGYNNIDAPIELYEDVWDKVVEFMNNMDSSDDDMSLEDWLVVSREDNNLPW
jgi:hypothetical protein